MDIKIVYTTFADEGSAEEVAEKLVQEGLAACVNIFPKGRSVYMWKERLQKESESYVFIKVSSEKLDATTSRLKELHPYEVPMISVIDTTSLNPDYSDWLVSAINI